MSDRVKLRFPFTNTADEDETETIWAMKREDGYEIDNIPFHVKDVALGDVVSVKQDDDGALWYFKLLRPSGHSTIHILFVSQDDVVPVREELRQLGCASEGSDLPTLVAVDVPPEVPYEKVKVMLDEGERTGRFEYREACLGFL